MYIHTSTCVCESRRCFPSFSPLNITYSFLPPLPSFCVLSRPCAFCVFCACLLPCVVWCAPFRLPVPVAPAACRLPSLLFCRCPHLARLEAPRPSVCPAVCRAACPSLVRHQAQDAVAVWADAPRICPRPYRLLSVMCCRCLSCLVLLPWLSCRLDALCLLWW